MAFQIEKGVPIPSSRAVSMRYPFPDMEVGDSFVVPFSAGQDGRLRSAACAYQRRRGGKFTVRRFTREGVVRCWRVA